MARVSLSAAGRRFLGEWGGPDGSHADGARPDPLFLPSWAGAALFPSCTLQQVSVGLALAGQGGQWLTARQHPHPRCHRREKGGLLRGRLASAPSKHAGGARRAGRRPLRALPVRCRTSLRALLCRRTPGKCCGPRPARHMLIAPCTWLLLAAKARVQHSERLRALLCNGWLAKRVCLRRGSVTLHRSWPLDRFRARASCSAAWRSWTLGPAASQQVCCAVAPPSSTASLHSGRVVGRRGLERAPLRRRHSQHHLQLC